MINLKPGGIRELNEQSVVFLINVLGLNELNEMFDEWYSTGKISRKTKSDLKKKVREVNEENP